MYTLPDYILKKYKEEFAHYKKQGYKAIGLIVNTTEHNLPIPAHVKQMPLKTLDSEDLSQYDYITLGPIHFTRFDLYQKDIGKCQKFIKDFNNSYK